MTRTPAALYIGLSWGAVLFYVVATVANAWGIMFDRERPQRIAYLLVLAGLVIHSVAIGYWWRLVGHGPYMAQSEVLASDAWIVLVLYLAFSRIYPRIRPVSIVAFPAAFLLQALGLFYNPGIRTLPPTFRSIWLVIHIGLYKVSLATLLIACAFSIFYLMKERRRTPWLERLPELTVIDAYAYRFAGFGMIFWTIGMLAGSIWAHQSWGRFWGWDPVETWSFLTWLIFGVYLHLRRFFAWNGRRAAWFFIGCFVVSLVSLFVTSHMSTSIHAEYFR